MPPTAKDVDVTNLNSTNPGARPASVGAQDDNSGKPQPVPLEVPVTVNGARTVEGSDKREPFSETSQTVLVFGNGAVIRLASSVAAGQLLFLTNDKTKKEVVCQVVKSKNYRNVSGYVELEFTEPVPGFWGMRFPSERVVGPPSAPVAKPAAPGGNSIPARVEPKSASVQSPAQSPLRPPVAPPVPPAPAATFTSSSTTSGPIPEIIKPALNSPRAAEPKPVTILPSPSHQAPSAPTSATANMILPKAPGLTDGSGSGLTSTARPCETKSPAPVAPKVSQISSVVQPSSEVLRRESERLQEQLASMLFAADVPATVQAVPVPSAPAAPSKPPASEVSGKVVEMAKPQTSGQSTAQVPSLTQPSTPNAKITPSKSGPFSSLSPLDDEELKIPSWLEPLTRNAATQAQNEPEAKEEPANARRVVEFEVQDLSAVPEAQVEEAPTPSEPEFGSHFLEEESTIQPENGAKGNNKGVLIGAVAAGILVLVAVGVWHGRQSSAPTQQTSVTTAATTAPAAATPSAAQPAAAARNATGAPTPNRSNINSEPVAQTQNSSAQVKGNSPSITPASDVTKISPDKNVAAELNAYKKLAELPPPVKKPGIGEVHLVAPKANRTAVSSDPGNADAELAMNPEQGVPTGDGLSGGLTAGNSSQPIAPTAPLAIGGVVKPARLLSSPPPTYPSLAKTQRIEGAVRVDALVDATGKVSSMKVISGPALLHQAALEALRQWKYQPATLDGQPVPMHLTVTLQFHLQ